MKEKDRTGIPYIEDNKKELDLRVLISQVFKEWKLLLIWVAVAMVLGIVVALSLPKTYEVLVKMAPESVSRGASSSLSSLTGLAGINLGSMFSSEDAVSPDIYPDIITSTPFAIEMLSAPLSFERKGKQITTDYFNYVTDYIKEPWWKAVFGFPKMLVSGILGLLRGGEKEPETEGIGVIDPKHLSYGQDAVVGHFRKYVILAIDKQTGMIILSVKEQDPEVSEQVASAVVKGLQMYVTEYRTEKARNDLEYYQKLADEARTEYYAAQKKYAAYLDRNQSIIRQGGRVEQDRLKNEVSLSFSLYNSCVQQVQAAQALVQQVTPAFSMIEPPVVPLYGKPSRALVVAVFIFLGGFLSILWILWGRSFVSNWKSKENSGEGPAEIDES